MYTSARALKSRSYLLKRGNHDCSVASRRDSRNSIVYDAYRIKDDRVEGVTVPALLMQDCRLLLMTLSVRERDKKLDAAARNINAYLFYTCPARKTSRTHRYLSLRSTCCCSNSLQTKIRYDLLVVRMDCCAERALCA